MKQYEQIIEVMRQNGGFATLGHLNNNVDVSKWKTKTPYASIRRIVQDNRFFFKIKPGLWALNEFKDDILNKFNIHETNSISEKEKFTHTYFQGLLLEIGKIKSYKTYIPPQDKNKLFLNKALKEIADITQIYQFSYERLVKRAKTVDVIWFNRRNMPASFFEVEHSTDIQNSLLKFDELQDFYSNFYIVCSIQRKREFLDKVNRNIFRNIKNRVQFLDYEYISNLHAKSMEVYRLNDVL